MLGGRKLARDYVTHKEIEGLCDLTLEGQGWIKQKLSSQANNLISKWQPFLPNIPDRVYGKKGEFLVLEIKPSHCKNGELKKALGQMMCLYPYNVKAYLLLSPKQWDVLKATLKFFPWIGILIYGTKLKDDLTYPLQIVQKAAEKNITLIPLPLPLLPKVDKALKRKWNCKAFRKE